MPKYERVVDVVDINRCSRLELAGVCRRKGGCHL